MTIECTNLDHSNYKIGTNHWGLEYVGELNKCAKCGRPTIEEWIRNLDWPNRDRSYWKQVFKDACAEQVFFFRAEPPGPSYSAGRLWVDADVNDPASILRPTRPAWLKTDIVVEIKPRRYATRMVHTKDHHYGEYQPGIDKAIRKMTKGLDYVDNIRYAARDNRKDMRRYREAQGHGCCGAVDYPVMVKGREFFIGCNYGH